MSRLALIRLLHTVVWAFFASCILALPFAAWARRFGVAALLIGIVTVEVIVIFVNRWTCPLTPIAARYTADRRDNFDIYLPEWLARHNKTIFGLLFGAGVMYTTARWMGWV